MQEQDISILKGFADNQLLVATVRKTIEEQFLTDAVTPDMTNETLGQITRARVEGLKRVDNAFKEIEKCKSREERKEIINPAR